LGRPLPGIVDAALRIKAISFLIDGEVVIARDDSDLLFLPAAFTKRTTG
jgi:ATP-dependent DNA ligase